MGNFIQYKRNGRSALNVIHDLDILTQCNIHVGLREDILKIFKNYVYYVSNHFFVSRSELKRISKFTSLAGIEEVVFPYFLKPKFKKVNIMEIFAALIIYSYQDFEAKINLAIHIFDFDGSKSLTEDEFFIMMKCFVVGISVMTFGCPAENDEMKKFVDSLYLNRNEMKNNEIILWVRQNPFLFDIFQINRPEVVKPVKVVKKKLLSMDFRSFDNRDKKIVHRRVISSYSIKRNDNYSVIVDSKVITKSEILNLKSMFDKMSESGLCKLKEILSVLKTSGYVIPEGIDQQSELLVSFNNTLEILFKNATKNQINRMLKFVGIKVIETKPHEREKTIKLREVLEPKQIMIYRNIFNRYDTNGDGKINLKELKNSLKDSLNEDTIEELYNQHIKEPQGLTLKEFIKMYAPEDIEIPENLI